jgi:hypothetical protein
MIRGMTLKGTIVSEKWPNRDNGFKKLFLFEKIKMKKFGKIVVIVF